jgi:hypothetical protein
MVALKQANPDQSQTAAVLGEARMASTSTQATTAHLAMLGLNGELISIVSHVAGPRFRR